MKQNNWSRRYPVETTHQFQHLTRTFTKENIQTRWKRKREQKTKGKESNDSSPKMPMQELQNLFNEALNKGVSLTQECEKELAQGNLKTKNALLNSIDGAVEKLTNYKPQMEK